MKIFERKRCKCTYKVFTLSCYNPNPILSLSMLRVHNYTASQNWQNRDHECANPFHVDPRLQSARRVIVMRKLGYSAVRCPAIFTGCTVNESIKRYGV